MLCVLETTSLYSGTKIHALMQDIATQTLQYLMKLGDGVAVWSTDYARKGVITKLNY